MDIQQYTAEDDALVKEVVDLFNVVAEVDSPWEHPITLTQHTVTLERGGDGEKPQAYVGVEDGRVVAQGELWVTDWDNPHLAWTGLVVHPEDRRRGHGSAMLHHLRDEARALGRSSLGIDAWDAEGPLAFAARHGFERKSAAINRRQFLDQIDEGVIQRMYDEATQLAASYELVRLVGRTPPEMLEAVAEMAASINDAPTDDLDIEDEVFPPERVSAYEEVAIARKQRFYRMLARHRDTGELAGHTVVAVEEERPAIGHQHDTTVVRAHRGHRLGLLLKAGMLLWLAELEPQLATIDTWNAESNDHMIAVNEQLGYRVLGRGVQFQRGI
jgi:GNAT superfamily N-acetyltransferase